MKFKFETDRYECLGYDGEGCKWFVNMEEVMIEIGTTEGIRFRVD